MQTRGRNGSTRARQRGISTLVLVIIITVVLLLAGGGAFAALYFTGMISGGEDAAAMAEGEGGEGAEGAKEPPKPPIYLPMEPPLVVNFDRQGRVGYLQVSIELMARDKATLDVVRNHMPVVRNAMVLMMSSQSYEQLDERSEKEKLRQKALEEVNAVLEEQGAEGRIESVYFTAFVMQ